MRWSISFAGPSETTHKLTSNIVDRQRVIALRAQLEVDHRLRGKGVGAVLPQGYRRPTIGDVRRTQRNDPRGDQVALVDGFSDVLGGLVVAGRVVEQVVAVRDRLGHRRTVIARLCREAEEPCCDVEEQAHELLFCSRGHADVAFEIEQIFGDLELVRTDS